MYFYLKFTTSQNSTRPYNIHPKLRNEKAPNTFYVILHTGKNLISTMASMVITYATSWKTNYTQNHHDDQSNAWIGVKGKKLQKLTGQCSRHGRWFPVSSQLQTLLSPSRLASTKCPIYLLLMYTAYHSDQNVPTYLFQDFKLHFFLYFMDFISIRSEISYKYA